MLPHYMFSVYFDQVIINNCDIKSSGLVPMALQSLSNKQ